MEAIQDLRQNNKSQNERTGEVINTSEREMNGEEMQRGNASTTKRTANRGFAAMDPAKQKQIAQQGGRAAHKQGVAHRWTSEEARLAGRKGGQNGKRTGKSAE